MIFIVIRLHHFCGRYEVNFCANFVPLAYKNRPYLGYVAIIKINHLTDIIIIILCSLSLYTSWLSLRY